jgi:hypothetical protein
MGHYGQRQDSRFALHTTAIFWELLQISTVVKAGIVNLKVFPYYYLSKTLAPSLHHSGWRPRCLCL